MRLSEKAALIIQESFRHHFHEDDHLWLFGSRVNNQAKGGDIDLYIETRIDDGDVYFDKQLKFIVDLKRQLGDQKIDVVIRHLNQKEREIDKQARQTGIQLA